MGVINLDKAEVTLLLSGKKKIKRVDGSVGEALIFEKFCKVKFQDGSEYFAPVRLGPAEIFAENETGDQAQHEHLFIEGYGVRDNGDGEVVFEKRGEI